MRIIFNPFADIGYYINMQKSWFNVKVVGSNGLLDILEQLTGNSGKWLGTKERKLDYHKTLHNYIQANTDAFFAASFKNDPIGVTSELLRYRDQLVLAGWENCTSGVSMKLDTLLDIESKFSIPKGNEDRWVTLYEYLDSVDSLKKLEELVLSYPVKHMHPFFSKLIKKLEELGVKVTVQRNITPTKLDTNLNRIKDLVLKLQRNVKLDTKDKTSFQILKFKTELDAAYFFSAQRLKEPKNAVFINKDNRVYNSVQKSLGLPSSGATTNDAHTNIIQLFKLSSALFTAPFNIINYMAYLQAPIHPVSYFIRRNILAHIARNGGINSEVINNLLDDFIFETKIKKNKTLTYLLFKGQENNEHESLDVIKFYKELSQWASLQGSLKGTENTETRKQLQHLKSLCNLLTKAVNDLEKEKISSTQLLNYINDIYEPVNATISTAEAYSTDYIADPAQLIDEADLTIWMDFYSKDIKPDWYDFLNNNEIAQLSNLGLILWDKEKQSESAMAHFFNGILKTKERLCLVVVEKVRDELTSDHPLFSLLKGSISNLSDFMIDVSLPDGCNIRGWESPVFTEHPKINLPEKQSEHQILQGGLIPKRETESFSSIDQLIQYPFDWVFQYGLQIKPGFSYELAEIETTLGNVAHEFIHDLFDSNDYNINTISTKLETDYTKLLKDTIINHGAILLLDENTFHLNRLKDTLLNSIKLLLQIVEENILQIDGSEIKLTEELPLIGNQKLVGSIDLILRDDDGRPVIIDLKWTMKSKKYMEKLREGKAIQLALYNELVSKSKRQEVYKTAYFLLSHGQLLSIYPFHGNCVRQIDSNTNERSMLPKIHQSILYRRNQFKNGVIEEAEELNLDEIAYYLDSNYNTMMGLEATAKTKKKNYYSPYQLFKGNFK